jgi:hypothetical protein
MGIRKIEDAEIPVMDGSRAAYVTIGDIAQYVADKKAKQPEEAEVGFVATALLGAAAVANKSPVITRRFWSLRRG